MTMVQDSITVEVDVAKPTHHDRSVAARAPQPARRSRVRHWHWALAVVALGAYLAFGYWLIFGADYVIGDALSRAASARSVAHSRDQHLMGVGFYWMPLPVFAQSPVMAVFSRLGHPQLAIPIGTALAGALTILPLVRAGRMLGLRDSAIAPVVLVYAFNPYTVFFAANGMAEAWAALFLACAVAAYVEWTVTRQSRVLGAFGISLALALLSKYEVLACIPLFAVVIAAQARRGRRVVTAVVAILPAIFTFLVWTIVALVITGRNPFDLVFGGSEGQRLESPGWLPDERTIETSFNYVLKMSALVAPGFLVMLLLSGFVPELLRGMRALLSRSRAEPELRLPALGAALPFAVFPGQVAFLLLGYSTFGNPRYFTPLILSFTFLGLIMLAKARSRAMPGTVTITLLLVTALGFANYVTDVKTLSHPLASKIEHEDYWIDLIRGDVTTVDTSLTRWREFTEELDAALTPDDLIAVDSGVAFPFQLLTAHPKQVALDRDKDSERLVSRNPVPFTYILYVDDVVSQSVMNSSLADALNRPPKGMRWELFMTGPTKEYWLGNVEVYKLVPAGQPATTPTTTPATSAVPETNR